jgi:succinate dehydrogenase / fumarate reductase, iron-sulfur subunit
VSNPAAGDTTQGSGDAYVQAQHAQDASAKQSSRAFDVWRGEGGGLAGSFTRYETAVTEGMVVLDAIHQIQAEQAPDLAVRWNCKAGKCGSCSAEINGMPKLLCMTRMDELPTDKPVRVEPMRAFPLVRDLVTDVSVNFRMKKTIRPFQPRKPDAHDATCRMMQQDVDRVQ